MPSLKWFSSRSVFPAVRKRQDNEWQTAGDSSCLGEWGIKGMKEINRVILEEQLSWSWFGVLNFTFWVSRCVERTGQVSAATPDPRDILSVSFLTLTSDFPQFFMPATEGVFCRDVLTLQPMRT